MKVISITKEKILVGLYLFIIFVGLAFTMRNETVLTASFSMPLSKRVVLIDPGHGGVDPGKVSGKTEEKNINLDIALMLQGYLETADAVVYMTRIDDADLAQSKKSDMYARKLTANTSNADIFVSIHQNSYPSASVEGAQVFYFNRSDNSKRLAESIQKQIKSFVDYRNRFEAKENSNYYVLKQTTMPAVIVECGFLSSPNEKYKLNNPDYQDRIAWAIYMGIVDYFRSIESE
ncbi:MAG: N-acetylmuramoyl-L-alanine amidase [Clostridiales bacterium]|jgi:N-acetylmuramoyl-L-alanine amidase|nr:N-acetylmuramoyl-L-alanine amidase [Clostridiales bacterium]